MEAGVFAVKLGQSIGDCEYLFYCSINGVLKLNLDSSDHRVANEFICGRLASFLGLPVPPGTIIKTKDNKTGYASLRFGSEGERPPPVIPKHLAADHPHLVAGIVVFDCWIANPDRHNKNLAYSRKTKQPPVVFDHDQALFGLSDTHDRLAEKLNESFVSDCLGEYITSSESFRPWVKRVEAIQNETIQEICEAATVAGSLNPVTQENAQNFLIQRRDTLRDLLQKAKETGLLPNLKEFAL
jgi:hypothetical protein